MNWDQIILRKWKIYCLMVTLAWCLLCWPSNLVRAQQTSGYTQLATVTAPVATYTDTTCPAGTTCSYEVYQFDTTGNSTLDTTSTGATSVSATPGSTGKIVVSWVYATTGTPAMGSVIYTGPRVPNPATALQAVGN